MTGFGDTGVAVFLLSATMVSSAAASPVGIGQPGKVAAVTRSVAIVMDERMRFVPDQSILPAWCRVITKLA